MHQAHDDLRFKHFQARNPRTPARFTAEKGRKRKERHNVRIPFQNFSICHRLLINEVVELIELVMIDCIWPLVWLDTACSMVIACRQTASSSFSQNEVSWDNVRNSMDQRQIRCQRWWSVYTPRVAAAAYATWLRRTLLQCSVACGEAAWEF